MPERQDRGKYISVKIEPIRSFKETCRSFAPILDAETEIGVAASGALYESTPILREKVAE